MWNLESSNDRSLLDVDGSVKTVEQGYEVRNAEETEES